MKYKCKKCGGKSKWDHRCSECGAVFVVPPEAVEESTEPEPKVESRPIMKSPTYSPTKVQTKVVSKPPTRNIVNDPPTQQEFSRVVIPRQRRARVGIDKDASTTETRNGPEVTNGPTTNSQTLTPPTTSKQTGERGGREEVREEKENAPKQEEKRQGSPGLETGKESSGEEQQVSQPTRRELVIQARNAIRGLEALEVTGTQSYVDRIKAAVGESPTETLPDILKELKEVKVKAQFELVKQARPMLEKLKDSLGKDGFLSYAGRMKAATGESPTETLLDILKELKGKVQEQENEQPVEGRTNEESPKEKGQEEQERREKLRKEEEERKRLEEEERKRKEMELARQKKGEIDQLLLRLHPDQRGTFAGDAGKAAAEPIDLSRLDEIKSQVDKKLEGVANQAREKKKGMDKLLEGLHADRHSDFPQRAANALAEPIDLKVFGPLEEEIKNAIADVEKRAKELKEKFDHLLGFFPPDLQPEVARRAGNAFQAKPIDPKVFDLLGKEIVTEVKKLREDANQKKAAIDELLRLELPPGLHGQFPDRAAAVLTTKPIDLRIFIGIEQEIREAVRRLEEEARRKKTAIDELLRLELPRTLHAQFPTRAAAVLTTKPIVLGTFTTIEQEIREAVRQLEEEARLKKTAIDELLRLELPRTLHGQFPNRAAAVLTTKPIILGTFTAIEQEIGVAVRQLAEEARLKKTELDQLLQRELPPDRHGQFPTRAAAVLTTKPIVLGTFTTIEQEIREAVRQLEEEARLKKTEIDQLLLGLPEQQRSPFSGRANQLLLAKPIDLGGFASIKNEVEQAIGRLRQPVGEQVRQKLQTLTNSEEERQALLRLPPNVGKGVTDLLETLAQQGKSAGREFANLADAKVALREAEQKIADAPLKQFNALRAAIRELGQELVNRKRSTAESMNDFLNGNLTTALNNFNISSAAGLKTLQDIWDMLKGRNTDATQAVEQGETGQKVEAEKRTLIDAQKLAAAARPLAALEGSIRFGPLSKLVGGKPSEEDLLKIIEAYKDNPELADYALDLAQRGAHPEVIARGLEVVVAARSKLAKDVTPEVAKARERQALEVGCTLGGDYFERMDAYYKTDAPSQPRLVNATGTVQEKGLAYTRKMAEKLLKPNGEIDFDPATGVLNDLNFHPKSLDDPLPALALTVEEFRKEVTANKDGYNEVLKGVVAPNKTTAQGLVRKTLGKTGTGQVSQKDAREAVLSAMLTPMDQGKVGSCHVTSPCIKFRANNPLGVMTDLKDIVKNGTLVKGGRPPVPVVTNIHDNENTLLRSWEYTVATAGVRLSHNDEKKKLSEDLFVDYSGQDSDFNLTALETAVTNGPPPVNWATAKQKIQDELSQSFQYKYNPKVAITGGTSSDNSSTEGKWELMHVQPPSTETLVGTEEDYKTHMKNAVIRGLKAAGVRDNSAPLRKVDQIIDSPQFSRNLEKVHPVPVTDPPTQRVNGQHMPWNKSAGGVPVYENEVLYGGHPQEQELYRRPSPTSSPSEKTAALLSGIAGKLLPPTGTESDKDPKKDLVTLRAKGVHAMNALPSHPSLQKLRGSNPTEVQQNVQRLLVDRGQEIARTPLKPERMNYLLDKALGSQVGEFFGGDMTGLTESQNRPTSEMTPAQFKQSILTKANSKIEAKVQRNISVNRPAFTEDTLKKLYEKQLAAKIDSLLLKELDYPEFVFADTNWGDPSNHTLLVMSSDPTTGEPKMWHKEEFSGAYSEGDPKWLDLDWSAVQ